MIRLGFKEMIGFVESYSGGGVPSGTAYPGIYEQSPKWGQSKRRKCEWMQVMVNTEHLRGVIKSPHVSKTDGGSRQVVRQMATLSSAAGRNTKISSLSAR